MTTPLSHDPFPGPDRRSGLMRKMSVWLDAADSRAVIRARRQRTEATDAGTVRRREAS